MIDVDGIGLVLPNLRYTRSYLEARAEGYADTSLPKPGPSDIIDGSNLGEHLASLSRPRIPDADDPSKPVPFAHFWMVARDEFISRVGIHYALNERLLRSGGHVVYAVRPRLQGRGLGHHALALGLAHLAARDVGDVLVTCSNGNRESARIIERADGVLKNKIPLLVRNAVTHAGKAQHRFVSAWIGTAFAEADASLALRRWPTSPMTVRIGLNRARA